MKMDLHPLKTTIMMTKSKESIEIPKVTLSSRMSTLIPRLVLEAQDLSQHLNKHIKINLKHTEKKIL